MNGSDETSKISQLSVASEKTISDQPRCLLKIFWDPTRLSQEGPTTNAIQARLIRGQGVG